MKENGVEKQQQQQQQKERIEEKNKEKEKHKVIVNILTYILYYGRVSIITPDMLKLLTARIYMYECMYKCVLVHIKCSIYTQ